MYGSYCLCVVGMASFKTLSALCSSLIVVILLQLVVALSRENWLHTDIIAQAVAGLCR